MHQNIDFIIVGGGLAGSILALELISRNADLLLIDSPLAGAASPIGAGIINPITGKRLVLEPEFEIKLATLKSLSMELELHSGRKVLTELPQTRYLDSVQSKMLPKLRSLLEAPEFQPTKRSTLSDQDNSQIIENTYRLDIAGTCRLIHNILESTKSRATVQLNYSDIDIGRELVRWHEFRCKKFIFCEGWRGSHNPWFKNLPFNLNKGQLLKISEPNSKPGLKNWGQWELHTGTERWLGATTERDYRLLNPDAAGRAKLLDSLASARELHKTHIPLIKDAQIINQYAGVRPATSDRKPFIGLHPEYPQLGIFNGFGGKGSLHIPHAAQLFADQLLLAENPASQNRLNKLLSNQPLHPA